MSDTHDHYGDFCNPDLVPIPSISEDEDFPMANHGDGDDDDDVVVDRQAIAFLLRYETMVRQQEAEDMATMAHIKPLLMRLEALSSSSSIERSMEVPDMQRGIPYVMLQQALDQLRINLKLKQQSQSSSTSSEFMTTDRQFMLLLQTLTNKPSNDEDEDVTYAELIQCYKVVVSGMQTLQHLQGSSARARARDRTLSLLSLFQSPSTKLLDERNEVDHWDTNRASRVLEMSPGGGIKSRLEHIPTVRNKANYGTTVLLLIMTMSVAGVSMTILRPEIVGEWKQPAQQHFTPKVDTTVDTPHTPVCVPTTPAPKSVMLFAPEEQRKPVKEERTTLIKEEIRALEYTTPFSFKKSPQPTLEYISHVSTYSKLPQQPQLPVDPATTLQNLLEENPSLQRSMQQRRLFSAAVGGVSGIVVAPVLLKVGAWIAKACVATVQGGGFGAWSVLTIASSLVLQLSLQGLQVFMEYRQQARNKATH